MCEYCDKSFATKPLAKQAYGRQPETRIVMGELTHSYLNGALDGSVHQREYDCRINYCPMCGRELRALEGM